MRTAQSIDTLSQIRFDVHVVAVAINTRLLNIAASGYAQRIMFKAKNTAMNPNEYTKTASMML
jgi:hypothetical protein